MRKSLIAIAAIVILVVASYVAYTALRPPFWETDNPLVAQIGPIDLLEDLDTGNLADGWKERTFFNIPATRYHVTEEDGARTLRCTTDASGSILARDTDIALSDLPILSWQWKVTVPINSDVPEDEEDGDDHPLRFYLQFANESGETKGAEIIWSNKKYMPGDFKIIGTFHHLVANGLDENAGVWHDQSVDLRQLYSDIGGSGAASLQVLGFFCDSDNTGAKSDGYFRSITLSAK
ncbi:DUF3047 domain-containing protein [Granulosicoccus sp.]|nr:DUF3047 domain-containing protein [Granulosicoccus sp.]